MTLAQCGSAIPNCIFEVYLTNDLGMPKENMSLMKVLFTPLNIVLAFFSSYLTARTPFYGLRLANMAEILLNAYGIFVIAGTFPAREDISNGDILHVSTYLLLGNLLSTFNMVTTFAFIMPITDKRISGVHVTFMACLTNLTSYLHKLYVFKVVDHFGIFGPQIFLTSISVATCLLFGQKFVTLDKEPVTSWHMKLDSIDKKKK